MKKSFRILLATLATLVVFYIVLSSSNFFFRVPVCKNGELAEIRGESATQQEVKYDDKTTVSVITYTIYVCH
jgi:hypothetical protein